MTQSRLLGGRAHPSRRPPRTSRENTVLDLVDAARTERPVIDLVMSACQRRLTTPARNRTETAGAARRYRDVRYLRWRLVVELDGLGADPEELRELHDLRAIEVAERGERTLRYGWRAVTGGAAERDLVDAESAAG